jgi:hypothetical protein
MPGHLRDVQIEGSSRTPNNDSYLVIPILRSIQQARRKRNRNDFQKETERVAPPRDRHKGEHSRTKPHRVVTHVQAGEADMEMTDRNQRLY